MADEELLPVKPTYNAISGTGDYAKPAAVQSDWFTDRVTSQPAVTFAQKAWHSLMTKTDPTFNKWKGIEGYEEYAEELIGADSQEEQDAIKEIIDRRKFQRITEDNANIGIMDELMVETLNPINYIPIPAVRGLGFIRGAIAGAGLNVAQTALEEGARQWSDPTATWQESTSNLAFSAVLGGAIGGPAGLYGQSAARRAAAIRAFDQGLGEADSLSVSLAVRGYDEDMVPIYERPFANPDGSVPKIGITMEPKGFKLGTLDGVNYVWSPDHDRWIRYSDQGNDVPDLLPEDITDQLGAPEATMERVMRVDDARYNREYNEGQWHDEIESYREDGDVRPAGEIIRNRKDHMNFRMREHLWAQQLERGVDEPLEDYNVRVGKEALKEMEATKIAGGFAGNAFVKYIGEHLNFSPMVKAITTSGGDNVVADTVLRIGNDSGFGIKSNEFGMSTPPSVLLRGLRHTVRWQQFRAAFDQEWVKFVSGQQSTGRVFQNANVTAQMYALKAGARRRLGANVLDYHTFSEMVGRAVFDKSDFTHKGFPVNENIRTAAKEYTRMMQEYDALQREAGVFRTQKNLQRDIRLWSKDAANYQHRVNVWLWGETGMPHAYHTAVRIRMTDGSVRIFVGDNHADAVAVALDTLGDEGVPLTEQMTLNDYGYVPRQRAAAGRAKPDMAAEDVAAMLDEGDQAELPDWLPTFEQWKETYRERFLENKTPAFVDEMMADEAALREQYAYELDELRAAGPDREAGMGAWEDLGSEDISPEGEPPPRNDDEKWEDYLTRINATHPEAADFYTRLYGGIDMDQAPPPPLTRRQPSTAEVTPEVEQASLGFDPFFNDFTTTGEAIRHIIREDWFPQLRSVARKLLKEVDDVPFRVVESSDQLSEDLMSLVRKGGSLGYYRHFEDDIHVRGGSVDPRFSGATPIVVLHEAVHAATARRIRQGIDDLASVKNKNSPHAKAVKKLRDFQARIESLPKKDVEIAGETFQDHDTSALGLEAGDEMRLQDDINYMLSSEHEFLTEALTSPWVRDYLQTLPYDGPGPSKNMWQRLWEIIGDLLGLSKQERNGLTQAMDLFDEFMGIADPDLPTVRSGGISARPEPRGAGSDFIDLDTMTNDRVRGLSPRQLEIYNQKRQALDQVNENIKIAKEQLQTVTDTPYLFKDADGNAEDYFNRYWNPSAIVANREAITYLITKWYEREGNTASAAGNAADTVQKMIDGDVGSAANLGSVSHLNQRALNIPNSFSVEHPTLGTVRVSDFINLNVLATSEHYISMAGRQIEMARMFGDTNMVAEMAKIREHLVDQGKSQDEIAEIENHIKNTRDIVNGSFKDRDPWALDNRFARFATDLASLSLLGKAAITSMVDIMHAPMAQGFGVFFSHVFRRMLDDVEAHGEDMRMGGLTNELFDFASTQHNARAAMMEHGQPDIGGTWLENLIHDRLPGFFKISGLTPLTVWLKTLVMDAAQHNVMADAIRISDMLKAGRRLTREDTFRLAALGIKPRDAVLLASMPYQTWKNGTLILPNTGAWTGPNARKAKELLLNAIHAEARRAIVTPSIGDQSTIFRGVFTVKGEKVLETDLMKIPMQFLGYGVAAHNKVLVSALQGRDRSPVMGMFMMVAMAFIANYLKTDSNSWKSKSYDDIIFEAVQNSGLGGFWFGDLNGMIEKASNQRLGFRPNILRPITGTKTRTRQGDIEALVTLLGAAPSHFWSSARAFVDPNSTASDYASAVRKIVPYRNVLWWERFFRDMTGEVAGTFEGERR